MRQKTKGYWTDQLLRPLLSKLGSCFLQDSHPCIVYLRQRKKCSLFDCQRIQHESTIWGNHSYILYKRSDRHLTWPFDLPCNRNRIPESAKFLLVEYWILSFEIGSTAQGIQNPTNVWKPKFKFQWKRLESSTCSPESTAWNPESRIYKWKRFPQLRGASSSHTSVWKTKAVPLYLLLTLSFLLLLSRKRLSRSWV